MITKATVAHRGAIMALRSVAVAHFQWNPTHASDVFRQDGTGGTTYGFFLANAMRYSPSKRTDAIRVIESACGESFTETRDHGSKKDLHRDR